ncbi:hypothetical protein [Planobispora takensis]|nr:hypothetical protein [Planobispora takensis]
MTDNGEMNGGAQKPRDDDAPRNDETPRNEDAPRGTQTPGGGDAPRGEGASRGTDAPRGGDAPRGSDPLGSAAEEAFRLFDTIQRRATRELRKNLIKGTMTGFGSAFSGGGSRGGRRDVWEEAVSEHEDEYICRACPVCRAMAAQRESGGQVADHLMQAGSELFAALKSAVDAINRPSPSQRAKERDASREDTPVEHIDLG